MIWSPGSNKSCLIILITLSFLLGPPASQGGQWINPKEVIGDPNIARLQQGRKELTPLEKEEIEKYGYTALEIITYVDDNNDPGQDYGKYERFTALNAQGNMQIIENLKRAKHYYKDNRALITYDGIKPGDVEYKRFIIFTYPPESRGMTDLVHDYLKSEKITKEMEGWVWDPKLRRIRKFPATKREDTVFGSDMTMDEWTFREPWEEEHRILGKDVFNNQDCFVIESRFKNNPQYYLSKRVSWVEEDNFLDMHEEQFNRQGELFRISEKLWEKIHPWGYWVWKEWNFITLKPNTRFLYQTFDWVFDQDLSEDSFAMRGLEKEYIWRSIPKNLPPFIKNREDFPPAPQVRTEFWDRQGVTIALEK